MAEAFAAAHARGAYTILNAAPMTELSGMTDNVDLLVVNQTEAATLRQEMLDGKAQLTAIGQAERLAARLATVLGSAVVITLGPDGAVFADGNAALLSPASRSRSSTPWAPAMPSSEHLPPGWPNRNSRRARLAESEQLAKALRLANAAAARSCTSPGAQAAMPTKAELFN